ncbi:MAG: hypothetical protein DI533_21155 [Cereibacter sphaeroides]|uniref:Sulfotransferase domain-containing protein n=1 Tax=Cereibacter sphaeroides TaxID=1063 RepID=A0A2W5S1B9_CERSP|nr:MAG: hypothetical protein DI533_21155 [Cereibacter sphaeroides]
MPAPNLLLVGCQKSGTTWTHISLRKSRHIVATNEKELHFFTKPETERDWDAYLAHFPARDGASYYMETTPNYFQLPSDGRDIATEIKAALGHPTIMAIFRNPVERYESAYIHHMDKGRLPYSATIRGLTTEIPSMLDYGRYGSILRHWKKVFPDIGTFFYDDIQADKMRFLTGMMAFLGLQNDLMAKAVDFRANDKTIKVKERHADWKMPVLEPETADQLRDYYRDEVLELQDLTGRDLSHWLAPAPEVKTASVIGLSGYVRRMMGGRA